MYRITLSNPGGELESRDVMEDDEEKVARVAGQMIQECGELHDGDTITVRWVEDDED